MGAIRPVITNFQSGELSPRLYGRVDSPMFGQGAKELLNFAPSTLGGADRRGGLEWKCAANDVDADTRIIPWSIND
jgi:hypothetical protein